jgi:hypothetical protein
MRIYWHRFSCWDYVSLCKIFCDVDYVDEIDDAETVSI